MKCWFCDSELIWQNDYSLEDYGIEEEGVVAVLQCSNEYCDATFKGYLEFKGGLLNESYK